MPTVVSWGPGPARKGGELADRGGQAAGQQLQGLADQQHIRVVRDVGAGGAKVKDASGSLVNLVRLLGVVAQVGHHVVAGAALDLGDAVQVRVSNGPLERVDLLGGDGQTQLPLAFGEGDPQLPPGAEAVRGGEDPHHLGRGVAFVERVLGRLGEHGGGL